MSEISSPTAPCDATSAFINDNQEKANNNPDIVINSDLNTQRTGSTSSTEVSSEHVINLSCDNSLYVGQCNADSFDSGFVKSDLESSKVGVLHSFLPSYTLLGMPIQNCSDL